ncbi:uncharacterized protein, partial [Hetaerina americana]
TPAPVGIAPSSNILQGIPVDPNVIQQLQQLQQLLLKQQNQHAEAREAEDQVKFDKKLLDFDYGEEEDEDGGNQTNSSDNLQQHHQPLAPQQQISNSASIDSLGSILSNPEVLRQLHHLQQTMSASHGTKNVIESVKGPGVPQQVVMDANAVAEAVEKARKLQEMQQQEEEFDKHLAQTIPNLPFASECELKPPSALLPGSELSVGSATSLSITVGPQGNTLIPGAVRMMGASGGSITFPASYSTLMGATAGASGVAPPPGYLNTVAAVAAPLMAPAPPLGALGDGHPLSRVDGSMVEGDTSEVVDLTDGMSVGIESGLDDSRDRSRSRSGSVSRSRRRGGRGGRSRSRSPRDSRRRGRRSRSRSRSRRR